MAAGDDHVDWTQWRALVVASLRRDLRRAGRSLGMATGGGAGGVLTVAVLQLLAGGIVSSLAWIGAPIFVAALLHLTYLALTIASVLLLEAHTLIVPQAEYELVAPRPVSSRTFFAARTTALLAYVGVIAGTQSLLPVVAYAFAGGRQPGRGLIGLLVSAGVTLTTTALVVAVHGLVLRGAQPRGMRTVLTVLQLVTSFSVYALLVLLPSGIGRAYLLTAAAGRPWWVRALPTAWAAAVIDPSTRAWWMLPVAVAVPVLAWWLAARCMSLDYAASAATLTALPADAARSPASAAFLSSEARAVALLARAQFRDDMRFRLAVLSIVPLTLLYLILGVVDEDMASRSGGHPAMVYVAVLLFPALLKGAFVRSEAYRAAWVFHATPVNAGRLLLGLRTVLTMWFLVPYVTGIGVLLAVMLPSVRLAVTAVVVVSLLSHALLLLMLIVDPTLPFSVAPQVGASTRGLLVAVIPAILIGQWLPPLLNGLGTSWLLTVAALTGLVIANVLLHRLLCVHADRLAVRVEFTA